MYFYVIITWTNDSYIYGLVLANSQEHCKQLVNDEYPGQEIVDLRLLSKEELEDYITDFIHDLFLVQPEEREQNE